MNQNLIHISYENLIVISFTFTLPGVLSAITSPKMQYFSTNRTSPAVTFREATLNGQPDDRGLYFPESIPKHDVEFVEKLSLLPKDEIAFRVIKPFVGDSIDDETLFGICSETVDFPFPLKPITNNIYALELFHGPTLAFKDVGARFMSRCLGHFSKNETRKTVVIVATSGDTGGAVAAGFHNVEGVEVVILYPKGRVSRVQELQLTTLGGNIRTLEVEGSFDDCQTLAKQALADDDLRSKVFLTSANSINVARWLPQQFYYWFAMQQWQEEVPPIVAVPSGNFGNICAGLVAQESGMPAGHFIAATNANDAVVKYIERGTYETQKSVATLSNAMDVGAPSNFVRMLEIFGSEYPKIKENVDAYRVSDDETRATMRQVFAETQYVLDPHGAVAYNALERYLNDKSETKGIILETAHPVKFDSVAEIIGQEPEVPASVAELFSKQKHSTVIPVDLGAVKEVILSNL